MFFAASLTQAVVFAVLLVGGFWLIDLYVPYLSNADLAAAAGAFVCYFVYCLRQVPDKILAARMYAMRPFFAEAVRARRLSPNETAAFARNEWAGPSSNVR
jgi:hypothetical protein